MAQSGHTSRLNHSTPFRVRDGIIIYLITLILLLWPMAINGAPFYSEDSPSYLRGGSFGINTGLLIIDQWLQSLFSTPADVAFGASDPNTLVKVAINEANGARSIVYSLATYLLRFPGTSLVALVVAQAAAVALVLTFFRNLIAPDSGVLPGLAMGGAVALLTSASWYAVYAVPDILAGVLIAGSVALTIYFQRLNYWERLLLVFLVAACVTSHGSHLPIAISVLAAGGAWNLWHIRSSLSMKVLRLFWFSSPLLIAIVAMFATSKFAFDEMSIAPKRYPISLARSVADGPGAWYLHEHCATERYAICEVFGPNPPRDVHTFLWSPEGVRHRATPEQMERIRAEESTIIRRATLAYPLEQAAQSTRNTFMQFFKFGLTKLPFGFVISGTDHPFLTRPHADFPNLKALGETTIYASFFASLALLLAIRRRLKPDEVAAILVALIGLLANAAVCGILSAVADRYQGRVVWVLPSLTAAILLRLWSERQGRQGRPSQRKT